jgi:hypothetical protein
MLLLSALWSLPKSIIYGVQFNAATDERKMQAERFLDKKINDVKSRSRWLSG